MNKKTYSIVIVSLFILIPFSLFISSVWLKKKHIAETQLQSGSVLPHTQRLPSFTLTDMNGQSFTNKNLQGHWSLLFFGFTRCPAVCPTSLAQLAQAQKLFAPGVSLPQVVFISIDPEHDSASAIKKYLSKFNPQFLGATGTAEQLDTITRALGVMYAKVSTSQNYTMNHSDIVLVINPQGEWAAVLTQPHSAKNIANDLALIEKP